MPISDDQFSKLFYTVGAVHADVKRLVKLSEENLTNDRRIDRRVRRLELLAAKMLFVFTAMGTLCTALWQSFIKKFT